MSYPRIYNAAVDMVDRNVAEGRGAKPAFIDPGETLTYGELQVRCNRMANLAATYGIERETRIALLLLDTVDFPVAFWGAIKAGVVPVCLNTLLTSEQYAYILGDSRARALLISAALLPIIQPVLGQLPFLKHVFVSGGEPPPFALSFRAELELQASQFAAADTCCDETAFWLYSSGSTGMPKGVRHVHSSPMETARLAGQGCLGIRENDLLFSAAKLFFAYGLGNAMSFPMSVGAAAVLRPERPTPESVFNTLHAYQPTAFFGAPTLYAAMLAFPQGTPENCSKRLRLCVSAGEALPAEIGKAFRTKFGVDVLDGVGSTEMLHQYVCNSANALKYGTSGRPVRGYEIRLVDEHGRDVADGEVGEMLVRGPSAGEGYRNQREKSRAT
ncbi:MAG TPA: benzoate-CoA ligase family protein, partial [Hyphomicrobiaceae bacterium]